MGKNKADKPLTHEEIWDDSALVQSWDDAVEEYKHYHSIHAKGENVEDVLREAQEAEQKDREDSDSLSQTKAEDTEADPAQATVPDEWNGTQTSDSMNVADTATASSSAEVDQAPSGPGVNMPAPILAQVQDESLKNLMMSWYYAGYYTGLHEGRQQANQSQK